MNAADLAELQSIIVQCALERLIEETYGGGNSAFAHNPLNSAVGAESGESRHVICSSDSAETSDAPPPRKTSRTLARVR
jgi:hypothetical protein